MGYILALDQGTTSSRAILFDERGHIAGVAQKEFRQFFPSPGWVEHDPQEIWSSQASVAAEVLARSGLKGSDLEAIGITNQRETTIVWDRKTGKPIYPAIVWQDRRTTEYCQDLKAQGVESFVQEHTGLLIDPYFSGSKIRWILQHVQGAQDRAERGELAFGTVDSWLVWKMTHGKVHITDVTNASRTLLMNLRTRDWDPELLRLFQVPRAMLPEIRSCSEIYAHTDPSLFSTPVPIAGIAGDQQAALIGQGCFQKGMAKNTYGTGCFLLLHTGTELVRSTSRLLTTVAYQVGSGVCYALEGSVFVAGAAVQWLRDQLGLIRTTAEIEKLAASVPDTAGVHVVPAFTGLGAPHWNPYTRGTVFGLTRGTTSAHLARATLEGIAWQVTDVLEAMEADSGVALSELRVDGGASANQLLMQMQADFLGAPVLRSSIKEATALGAAFLAGLAVGTWHQLTELSTLWSLDHSFAPHMEKEARLRAKEQWQRAVRCAQCWEARE